MAQKVETPFPCKVLKLIMLAVATVLGNWHNVLRAISMASSTFILVKTGILLTRPVKIPKLKETEDSELKDETKGETPMPLPQTLVRIPTEHAPMLQQNSTGGANE